MHDEASWVVCGNRGAGGLLAGWARVDDTGGAVADARDGSPGRRAPDARRLEVVSDRGGVPRARA